MTSRDPASLPRNPRIRTLPYTEEAITPIADLLDAEAGMADFRLPSSAVYQLTVQGTNGRPTAMVTLWPGIRRVDVVSGPATVVFTDIRTVDLVPGVEVQFRRTAKECLIVAKNGQIIVRA
ncbi:MAG TPA: hypothetical protein VNZ58_00445 [Thermomicrobiales bacterium]|nr:hypothetical protein [Thermomicrobiales bacterium]